MLCDLHFQLNQSWSWNNYIKHLLVSFEGYTLNNTWYSPACHAISKKYPVRFLFNAVDKIIQK